MRIDRIRSIKLTGLGDVDWTFPLGPGLFFSEDRSYQQMLDVLLDLFYNFTKKLTSKTQRRQGLLEVWMHGEGRYYIRRQFDQQNDEPDGPSMLIIEDQTGQTVSLPKSMKLGEYLFRVKLQAFLQGGVIEWPKGNTGDNFSRRAHNLRQSGDELLSLTTVRAVLASAQKRVNEQKESMMVIKAEYDALRQDWEAAYRQQEENRLLLIEIKNLQEKELMLAERLASTEKLQERLNVLAQNPDYRELRQLQGELMRLEKLIRDCESKLTALTRDSQIDWALIETSREECMEWASVEARVTRLTLEVQNRANSIDKLNISLQMSGYQELQENAEQRLRRAAEDRDTAQKELDKLWVIKLEMEKIQSLERKERDRLQEFALIAKITDADEIKIEQRERNLAQWQSSKMGRFLDRMSRERLGGKSIGRRLAVRLAQDYQDYNVLNHKEFKSQLKEFRDQRQKVEQLQMELEQLKKKASRETKLFRKVHINNEILNKAFIDAKVDDFPTWLIGWKDYQKKKLQLSLDIEALLAEQELLKEEEEKLAMCAEQLQGKFETWETPTKDRDEVLAAVLLVARQLREKEEAEREIAVFSQKFHDLLGVRNIEHLAKTLEPLADLEREAFLSNDKRRAEIIDNDKEQLKIRRQLKDAELKLNNSNNFPSLAILEKNIENVSRKWMAYKDLHLALEDVKGLLEVTWQDWQTKYGKPLEQEAQWIFKRFSNSVQETIEGHVTEAKKDYFSYRMAVAHLAIPDNIEAPLFFFVEEMKEENLWKEFLGYLRKLSLSRQVILGTNESKLGKKIPITGWHKFKM